MNQLPRRIAVVGPPCSGKTNITKHILREIIHEKVQIWVFSPLQCVSDDDIVHGLFTFSEAQMDEKMSLINKMPAEDMWVVFECCINTEKMSLHLQNTHVNVVFITHSIIELKKLCRYMKIDEAPLVQDIIYQPLTLYVSQYIKPEHVKKFVHYLETPVAVAEDENAKCSFIKIDDCGAKHPVLSVITTKKIDGIIGSPCMVKFAARVSK